MGIEGTRRAPRAQDAQAGQAPAIRKAPKLPTRRELKRKALLQAAVAAFNKQGFHQTSLEEIGERLGMTKAALYYYFPSKAALLATCFDQAMDVSRRSLAQSRLHGRNGRENIIGFFRFYVENMTAEHEECFLLTEDYALDARQRAKLIKQRDAIERQLRKFVADGIKDGSIVRCDPKLAVFLLLGAVNWVPKWFSAKGPWTSLQLAQAMTEMLDRMLSTESGRPLAADAGRIVTGA